MIIYQEFDLISDLIAYAKSQSRSAILEMYSNFIEYEIYDSYNIPELINKIPNENNAKYNTKKENTKFIFLECADIRGNAYISVISDKPDDITLYTSFKLLEERLSPNPSTEQIYSLDILNEKIQIDFITTKSITVNLLSIYGEAKLYYENEPQNIYYVRGEEDNIEMVIPAKEEKNQLLIIENLRYNKPDYKAPGFAFLLKFYLRNEGGQIDMIKVDEASEIIYKKADFPVYYYSKIFDKKNDLNVFFYLHNIKYNDNTNIDLNREILSNELILKGGILDETDIYELKKDPKETNNLNITGVYDSTLKAGSILISKSAIENINKPVLYLSIGKGQNGENIKYEKIRGEIGISTINGDAPVPQKLYQFGKIDDYYTLINYKLKSDYNSKYMKIQFSSNSKYVNFAINEKSDQRKNETFNNFTAKKENGVTYITFTKPENISYLYLSVFLGQDSKNKKLNNYVFKYMNENSTDDFTEYSIINNDPKIELEKNLKDKSLKVKFNKINYKISSNNIDTSVVYTVKLVPKKNSLNDENINQISISESDIKAKQITHDESNLNEKAFVEFNNINPDDIKYIQVFATITEGSNIEYISYQAIDNNGAIKKDPDPVQVVPPPDKKDSGNDKKDNNDKTGLYVIIGISSFLLGAVIAFSIWIFVYNKRKSLLQEVNKISFVESGSKERGDILLPNDQNELD